MRRLDVAIKSPRAFDGLMRAEHDVGRFRRQLAAVVRGTGLHDDRLALRRARDRERSLHLEELALVIEHVPPVRVVEAAVVLVEHEGIVVPAVPQATHDVDELARAPIALVLRQMILAAESSVLPPHWRTSPGSSPSARR